MRCRRLVQNVDRSQSSDKTQPPVAEEIVVGETSSVEVGDAGVYFAQRATTETSSSQFKNVTFELRNITRFNTSDKGAKITKAFNAAAGATEVCLKPSSVERIGFDTTNDFDGKAIL